MDVEEFVTRHLPYARSRVLEVGCGDGEFARALDRRGFVVTAIDPEAPHGELFERVPLEDFRSRTAFDAVVAARSLHHIHDLEAAVEKIHGLLRKDGVVILDEFGWDQMDAETANWYLSKVVDVRPEDDPLQPDDFPAAWIAEHDDLHDSISIRRALALFFREILFERTPYLAKHLLKQPKLIEEESRLIRSGDIKGIGFRYVGVRDRRPGESRKDEIPTSKPRLY
jgi:SAM-dependent methyltransferase